MSKQRLIFLIIKTFFFSVFEPTRLYKRIIMGDAGFFTPEIRKTLEQQIEELKKGNQLVKEFKNIPYLYYNKIKAFLQKIIDFLIFKIT